VVSANLVSYLVCHREANWSLRCVIPVLRTDPAARRPLMPGNCHPFYSSQGQPATGGRFTPVKVADGYVDDVLPGVNAMHSRGHQQQFTVVERPISAPDALAAGCLDCFVGAEVQVPRPVSNLPRPMSASQQAPAANRRQLPPSSLPVGAVSPFPRAAPTTSPVLSRPRMSIPT